MKRALHYLRIGWTVYIGVLCLLLIGLWVRSYWWADRIVLKGKTTSPPLVLSMWGHLFLGGSVSIDKPLIKHYPLIGNRIHLECFYIYARQVNVDGKQQTQYSVYPFRNIIAVPFALLLPTVILTAAAPWFLWPIRFSLRTLLIIITAVAVGLWIILWMARR